MTDINYAELVEARLRELAPGNTGLPFGRLPEAIRYSLLCGGKRIRPVLLLEFCALCGGDVYAALPFACAVEMVHTYSLIHDDLPCMDNDDLRRGKPSCHVAYGEDTALLAGDALLTMAFETMLAPENIAGVGPARAAGAAGILARAAGLRGMVGGQMIDLNAEGKQLTAEELRVMDRHKTGALIEAAAEMGCVLAGAGDTERIAAKQYAAAVGLAFQIVDDILDVTGDPRALGKKVGSDSENQKCTYVSLLGLEAAESRVRELTGEAVESLRVFSENAAGLAELAQSLAKRKK